MPIQCDYHMHTPLCQHAAGPMEAYLERAIELGLREAGFSDHNPLPDGLGANVRMKETELEDYVERVLHLQSQYRGQIKVRLGLELDYIEGLEDYLAAQIARYPFDYILGSVHYLDRQCRIGSWSPATNSDRYAELIRKLARSGLCDIVAHLDVVKRSGQPASPALGETLRDIANAGLCLEINTSGYRHPELPQPQPYPGLSLIRQAIALGIPLTVNSDAHAPEQVGMKFAEMETFLRANGCRQLARFDKRRRQMYEI